MAKLYFRVASDWQEVEKLRKEIDKLKESLRGINASESPTSFNSLNRRLERSSRRLNELTSSAAKAGASLDMLWKKALGAIGGAAAITSFAKSVTKVRGEFQQLEIAFETMLKSKEKADALMSELVSIAAKTPFDLQGVASSAKQMLAYGSSAESVGKELVMLGNVAAGVGSQLSEIAYLYGTLRTQGRAYTVDIRQFAGRGIPIYEELAKVLGVTKDKVSELVTAGKVGFREVEQAFQNMTSSGGIYFNLMEEQSKSLTGQISNLGDAWDTMLNEIGKETQGAASMAISATKDLIENYETVGKSIAGLVATYGAYKAAVAVATVAVSRHTFAEVALTNVRVIARRAQMALNTAMLTNPYIALATVVAGLVATTWALSDSTTSAERAAVSFKKKMEELNNEEANKKKTLESLIDTINSEVAAETDRIEAMKKMKEEYPAILQNFIDEEGRIKNLTGFWKAYNEEVTKSRFDKKQKIVEDLEAKLSGAEWAYGQAKKEGNRSEMKKQKQRIDDIKNELTKERAAVLEEVNKELQKDDNKKKDSTYNEDVKKAKKEWDDAKKAYEAILKDEKATTQKVKEAREKVKSAEKKYNELTDSKTAQKQINDKVKYEKQVSDKTIAIKRDNLNREISLMQEGLEKKLKQIEADYNSQKEKIEKNEKELAAANKEAGKSNLNKFGLTEEQQEEIDKANRLNLEQRKKAEDDLYRAEADAMRNHLREYGTFQEQKLAIAQEYATKIKEATTEGERLSLIKERDSELHNVDMNAISMNIDWGRAFGDLTGMLGSQMKNLLKELEAYVGSDKFKKSGEADKKVVYEAIERLKELVPGGEGTLNFGELQQKMKSLGDSVMRLQAAQTGQILASSNLTRAQEAYKKAVEGGNKAEIEKAKTALDIAKRNKGAADNEVNNSSVEMNQIGSEFSKASKDTINGLNSVAEGLQGFASGTLRGSFEGLQKTLKGLTDLNIGGKVGDAIGSLSETLSSAGVVGQIVSAVLSIFDVLKEGVGSLVSSLIDTVLGAVTGILDDILSGDFIKKIGGSLVSGVGGLLNTVTFGGFNSLFGIGGNAKEVEAAINRLTDRNETLQTAIEDLTDEMKGSKGMKSVEAYQEAKKLQEEQNRNYLEIAKQQAGYSGSHHSWNYYMKWNDEMIRRAREATGKEDFSGTGSLWELSPEQMKKLREDVWLWERIQKAGKGNYGGRLTEKLDAYIDQAGKLEELTDKLYEGLTGISFDGMYDSFIDKLMDMKYSAKDAAEDISKQFMQAMLANKIGEMYSEKLKGWWERFGKAMKNDGTLDNDERDKLMKEYMDYMDEAIKIRDELASVTGYDKIFDKESTQDSSRRGFGSEMTHEDAGELSGRFAAVQIATEGTRAQSEEQTNILSILSLKTDSIISTGTDIKNIADDTRTIIANSYLELVQISENTGAIVKPIQQMQKDIEEVKKNTSRL